MSTYGDRGNIFVLQRRAEWRGIEVAVVPLTVGEVCTISPDIVCMGGAQDNAQASVAEDLRIHKAPLLTEWCREGVSGLFVCAGYQMMGSGYTPAEGTRLEGVGIFPIETEHPGQGVARLTGNIVATVPEEFARYGRSSLIGFENHGGRTVWHGTPHPFAHVVKGYGNNGTDGTEGALNTHFIGSYFHGPLLTKNPHVADWLLYSALERKYGAISYTPLDDTLIWRAHDSVKHAILSGVR